MNENSGVSCSLRARARGCAPCCDTSAAGGGSSGFARSSATAHSWSTRWRASSGSSRARILSVVSPQHREEVEQQLAHWPEGPREILPREQCDHGDRDRASEKVQGDAPFPDIRDVTMTNTNPASQQLFYGRSICDPSHALSLRAVGISCSLVLITLFGSGCRVFQSLCAQELRPARTPDHDREARYYRDEALRMMTDSSRHSELAVQYAEKTASGSDASLWRDLAEYHLQLASYELNAASLMVAIAMAHWQLAHGSQPPGKAEDSP